MTIAGMGMMLLAAAGATAPIPVRTPIGSFPIEPAKAVTHVETTRVDFLPGQEMPEHMHPVPVVCFVAQGSFLVSIGRAPVRTVTVGDTTLERAGEVVHYFRNASASERAQLYCAILAGPEDKQLSVMLNR
ncbi:MAG: cupin domain-containing protein [Sphingomicrobium sp.]